MLWPGILVGLFFLLSAIWAIRIPIPLGHNFAVYGSFNADEHGHFALIQYMMRWHRIPRYSLTYYDTTHPPTYYLFGVAVEALSTPLLGVSGAFLLLRLMSCVMGAITVWMTYAATKRVATERTALLAAACAGGVPMFVSEAGGITNEVMSVMAATISLYLLIVGIQEGFSTRRTWILAFWVTLAIGAKLTCLGLLPAAWAALIWTGRHRRVSSGSLVSQISIVTGVFVAVLGWWFVQNQIEYGDPLKANLIYRTWSPMQPGFLLRHARYGMSWEMYLLHVTSLGWQSFWGDFNAMMEKLPPGVYGALAALQLAAIAGFARWIRVWRTKLTWELLGIAAVFVIFGLSVLATFYSFNWKLFTPQGRYFFPLLLPIGLLTAVGWQSLFPTRLRGAAAGGLMVSLLLLNVWCLLAYS